MNNLWILDNGHGEETAGKRSPVWKDGTQLFEWEFNRDIVRRIVYTLDRRDDIQYHVLVPEKTDIPLQTRVERANELFLANAKAVLVSIHGNAGGGKGWEVWTYENPNYTVADRIADLFYNEAQIEFPEMHLRQGISTVKPHKESQFKILKDTFCPAILTENFFYDTEEECKMMMENNFRQRIANMHIKAILRMEGII
jgi:N-acetylmuramoyl-L-alanine amidase